MRNCRFLIAIITLLLALPAHTQIVSVPGENSFNADSVREEFDNGPYFTLYKDNYFIAGTTLGGKPTSTNSDVKFQISIAQRITKSVLPFNSYLFLMYTQKCFWNVFEESLPMRDLNFNPGIGITKLLIAKGRLVGKATILAEHESNGRDGLASRSWNRISFCASIFVDPNIMIHGKTWIPIIDGENNRDILDYCGIYQTGVSVMSQNRRFQASVILTKRRGWNLNFNTVVELSYRIFKKDNQSLFLQYYNGYGENLLDYNRFHSRLRVGIVIKPKLFSDF
ncbi:MAG: phospholipase A [Muribaculaceae bacterium]|nr:phospholipase A [Muribaculaceae bacterium]